MKKTLLTALFVLIALTIFAGELRVTVTNYTPQVVILSPDNRTGDTLFVSPQGVIQHKFTANTPTEFLVIFMSSQKSFYFYAENNYSVDVKFDLATAEATFSGDGVRQNEYIAAFNAALGSGSQRVNMPIIGTLTFKEYEARLNEIEKELKALLAKVDDKNFVAGKTKDLDDTLYGTRFRFAWATRGAGKKMDADPDFVAFARSIDMNNKENAGGQAESMRNPRRGLASQVIRWSVEIEPDGIRDRIVRELNMTAKLVSNEEVRNALLSSFAEPYLSMGGGGEAKQVFELFKSLSTDPAAIARAQASYDKIASLAAGTVAPNFKIYDPLDKESQLSDLRGKVLFIDVWATWCGPCTMEAPFFEKLAETFKDDNRIQFVAISADDNVEAWKKAVAGGKSPHVSQFLVKGGMKSEMNTLYGISSIPRFLLINTDGRVIDSNAPRPSSKETEALLKSLLK